MLHLIGRSASALLVHRVVTPNIFDRDLPTILDKAFRDRARVLPFTHSRMTRGVREGLCGG